MRDEIKKTLDESILYLYENAFPSLTFPIEPFFVVNKLEKCRYVSCAKLAKISGQNIPDIIRACNSSDGCTHYDKRRDRYLMVINESGRSRARVRWTMAHELGHISAGHFIELSNAVLAEATPNSLLYMEKEADYFAASFLAPLPAIRILNAKCADDIRVWFGLSHIASEHRWEEFLNCSEKPSPFDSYFLKHGVRSATKKGFAQIGRPINIWADETL